MMSKRMFVISLIVFGLLINGFNIIASGIPVYEDYTTYDEVDPNTDITVTTNTLTISTMMGTAIAYVKDFKDVNHFGDFEHLVDCKITQADMSSLLGIWAVTNTRYTHELMFVNNEGLGCIMYRNATGVYQLILYDYSDIDTDTYIISLNTPYYLIIKRDGTAFTAKIYSDSDRTTLLHTLSLTVPATTWSTILAVYGWGHSTITNTMSGVIEKLALRDVPQSLIISNPYPENNSVDVCPCIDCMHIDIDTNGTSNMNLSFYHSIGDASDFHITEKYYNLTSGTYSFCMCGHSFVPAYIYQHTNVSYYVAMYPGLWQHIGFSNESDNVKNINHTWYNSNNDTFNILYDGIYRLAYRLSFEDTAVAPTSEAYGRIIVNGIEVAGTLQMKGMFNKNEISSVSAHVITQLYAGDKIKLQFTGDSSTIRLATHTKYGDIPNSAILTINRIDDADQHPMHYNETYYWYVNLSEYGNSSNYNISSIYKFTTMEKASDCEILSESKADDLFLSSAFSLTEPSMLFILWLFLIVLGEWKRDMLYKTLQIPLGVFYGVTLLSTEMWLGLIMICVSIYIGAMSIWQYRKE